MLVAMRCPHRPTSDREVSEKVDSQTASARSRESPSKAQLLWVLHLGGVCVSPQPLSSGDNKFEEELVMRLPQRHNVVDAGAVLLFMRRNVRCPWPKSRNSAVIQSNQLRLRRGANLRPKWENGSKPAKQSKAIIRATQRGDENLSLRRRERLD